jgi:hypothetical protein
MMTTSSFRLSITSDLEIWDGRRSRFPEL